MMELCQLLNNPDETPAVICGSGISFASGLPTAAGLYDLLERYAADDFAKTLFARHQPGPQQEMTDPPYTPVRFEGILDVLQRLVDPKLTVLAPYRGGEPRASHQALAAIAMKAPVVTANFDGLIERCMTSPAGGKDVFFTEDHFSSGLPNIGLWKIHGTVVDPSGEPIGADEDGGPVGTLRVISRVRESKSRQAFVSALLKQYAVIVVGYSGSDDFDITRWLRDAENPRQLIWIQYAEMPDHERVSGADLLSSSKGTGSCSYDGGLRRLATVWQRKDQLEQLVVVRSRNPEALLCDLAATSLPVNKRSGGQTASPLTAGSISEWQRLVVTGSMLAELSYFETAIGYLRRAVEQAPDDRQCSITLIELSRALLRLGGGNNAFDEARKAAQRASDVAVRTGDPDLIGRAVKRAKLIELNSRRLQAAGQMSDSELDNLDASLERIFVDCTAPACIRAQGDIGFEALTVLQQHRRFRGKPPGLVRQGIKEFGLLEAKATMNHDQALRDWKASNTRNDLDAAIETLREAAELREDLGDVPGASASWNVLGFMYQRLAWLSPMEYNAQLECAADAAKRALGLARRNAIPFAENQAMVGAIVLHLRRQELSEASDGLATLAVRNFQLDLRTKLEARFCIALRDAIKPVTVAGEAQQLEAAAKAFRRVLSDIKSISDDRFARIRVCALVNAALCDAGDGRPDHRLANLGPLDSLTPKLIVDELRTRVAATLPTTARDLAAVLLDPLGP